VVSRACVSAMADEQDAARWLDDCRIKDHLQRLLQHVIVEKPSDACGLVEILSRALKHEMSIPQKVPYDGGAISTPQFLELTADLQDESGGPVAVCSMPEFSEVASMLSWAGVDFSDVEAYELMCSMKRLAVTVKEQVSPSALRFWGKVFGTMADYYVVEVQREEGERGDVDEEDAPEPPGQPGANLKAYFVTNDLCGKWSLLPDVRPSQIQVSRRIRRLLTGHLNAPVVTHPFFPGPEQVLLRALIARISADTVICPKGFYVADEDDPKQVTVNEEFGVGPSTTALLNPEMWTHMHLHVLRSGLTSHPEVPDEDDEDELLMQKRARLLAEREIDPEVPLLRSLDSDGLEWVIRQPAHATSFMPGRTEPEGPPATPVTNAVAVVRSLTWPGAVCVARGGLFANLYVGYGLPCGEEFHICAPPEIHSENEDVDEQREPNGEEEAEEPSESEEPTS